MSDSFALTQSGKTEADWMSVPPVFIVGCPRSGTTLLRLMLTAHPSIFISSEGAHIYTLWRGLSSYGDLSEPTNLDALHRDILPILKAVTFISPPAPEDLLDWVKQFGAGLRSLITFYGTWEARALGKKELTWWGDNAPYHVYNIPFFSSLFPDSKYLFILRDPRDACASAKTAWPWLFEWAVGHWENSLRDGLSAGVDLGPSRFKTVRYESLVTAPGQQLRDICNFLGVEYTEAMLTYYQSDAARAVSEQGHHKNLLRPVFAGSIGNYRQVLTQKEIDEIEDRLFTPMRHLGYLSYEEYEGRSLQQITKTS